MDCYYINLDSAAGRRAQIEANFAEHKAPGWTLTRFPAVDIAYVEANEVGGALKPAEKACFISHRNLLGSLQGRSRPVMVMEDDAIIGPRTCALIGKLLSSQNTPTWDILFTTLSGLLVNTMLDLATYRNELAAKGEISLLDLKALSFYGTSAYIVNPASIEPTCALLRAETALDTAYDLVLSRLIRDGKLRGFGLFPFVTSLSDLNLASQIRGVEGRSADRVWHAFSRMTWVDRDPAQHAAMREAILPFWRDDKGKQIEALFAAIEAGRGEYR